ncbi:hypothetical protein JG688_00001778 [Phytophthora aleatoria]|uniref:Reverse transcriptase RNase H-like domain-containing protein n=1 Tax=Phytophthora aleatoria TaxID=2496075 RepID=A0A8J5MI26_9STRA|nr:hypothetical protein JG688_00001778 [Phytophthora aleatoria]
MQFDDEGRKRGVSYWSRQFKAVEWNYPIYDKALLAMRNVLIKLPDGEDGRERARDIASTQLNGVPNRTVAKPATQGIFTCADTGAVASATPGLTEPRVDTGATPTNATITAAHEWHRRAVTRGAPESSNADGPRPTAPRHGLQRCGGRRRSGHSFLRKFRPQYGPTGACHHEFVSRHVCDTIRNGTGLHASGYT